MLTVCTIVKNESLNICDCLNSFSNVADRFVIVDTGSTDDTKLLISKRGGDLFDFQWNDDFSAARNFALSKVNDGWVMMIDADSRINEEDVETLSKFVISDVKNYDVLDLKCEFNGSFAYLPKIWRADLGLKYKYPVHEYLEIPSGLKRKSLDLIISGSSSRDYKNSRTKYVEIMEKYIDRHPQDLRMLYYLIADNRFLNKHKSVVKWVNQYFLSDPKSDNQAARVLCHLGFSLWKLGKLDEAESAFELAVKFENTLIDSYLALGDLKFQIGKYYEALEWYSRADMVSFNGYGFYYQNSKKYNFTPKKKLAFALEKVGRVEEAIAYAKQAFKLMTDNELEALLTRCEKKL